MHTWRRPSLSLIAWGLLCGTSSARWLSLITLSDASNVVWCKRRLENPPRPSAASFIKWPLVLKTGRRIPQGLVCFLLQQRSVWPVPWLNPLCSDSAPSVTHLCVCVRVHGVLQDLGPDLEDAWANVRWASAGKWEEGRRHDEVYSWFWQYSHQLLSVPSPRPALCGSYVTQVRLGLK